MTTSWAPTRFASGPNCVSGAWVGPIFAIRETSTDDAHTVMGMTQATVTCPSCGAVGAIEPGFLEDRGEGSAGYLRWIAGPLERGIFGGAKVMGKERVIVEAFRCRSCGLLSLFARQPS